MACLTHLGRETYFPWNESSLVQVIAYRLFLTKPLPEPMLIYHTEKEVMEAF